MDEPKVPASLVVTAWHAGCAAGQGRGDSGSNWGIGYALAKWNDGYPDIAVVAPPGK